MEYRLTPHARKRMKERSVTTQLLENALHKPTKVLYDEANKTMFMKLYRRRNSQHLLIVVAGYDNNHLKIITIIDTSKITKYL